MSWVVNNLGQGERYSVSYLFPKKLFPSGISNSNLKRGSDGSGPGIVVIIFIMVGSSSFLHSSELCHSAKTSYSGGRIFYGGIPGGGGGGSGGGRSCGGGGGFGGSVMSCACACVMRLRLRLRRRGRGGMQQETGAHLSDLQRKEEYDANPDIPDSVFRIDGACEEGRAEYDQNTSVPKGDPSFPPLENSWVIDRVGVSRSR